MNAKRIFSALVIAGVVATLVTVVGTWSRASRASGAGQQESQQVSEAGQHLEGTWIVTVTPMLPPGSPPVPPFTTLSTFTPDGSVVGSGPGIRPPLGSLFASAQHGEWIRIGDREFAVTFIELEFDGMGNFKGIAKIRGTVTLDEALNEYSGPFMAEFLDPAGNVRGSGRSAVTARRIDVEPLP